MSFVSEQAHPTTPSGLFGHAILYTDGYNQGVFGKTIR